MHQQLLPRLDVLDDFIINLDGKAERRVSVPVLVAQRATLCTRGPRRWLQGRPAGHLTCLLIAAKSLPSGTLQNMLERTRVPFTLFHLWLEVGRGVAG